MKNPPPVDKVRVSIGTAVLLGLEIAFMNTDSAPTTAYLQTYYPGRCLANCKFCAQARGSHARLDKIARGLYLPYNVEHVLNRLKKAAKRGLIRRICVQTMNYPNMLKDLLWLVNRMKVETLTPISVSIHSIPPEDQESLRDAGAEKLVIPLDAANETLFDEIKGRRTDGPYRWNRHMLALQEAVRIMGRGNVGTHLIVGLGETEKDVVFIVERLRDMGVYCGLFAFTPIPGTPMAEHPSPSIEGYRRLKVANYMISKNIVNVRDMAFGEAGEIIDFGVEKNKLDRLIESGEPFLTSGCPGCNRPYATEIPSGSIYNYPRLPSREELKTIKKQMQSL
jgi:biotin synthase-related radical SAM superfamily protein